MAKAQTKSKLPEGYVPVRAARSAGFYVPREGNKVEGILVDVVEVDDPFNKGKMRTFFKVQLTEDGTVIVDSETKKEREAATEETIGVDEKGFLKVLRELKGRQIFILCTGQQSKGEAKKGRNPAWLFEVGAVPA